MDGRQTSGKRTSRTRWWRNFLRHRIPTGAEGIQRASITASHLSATCRYRLRQPSSNTPTPWRPPITIRKCLPFLPASSSLTAFNGTSVWRKRWARISRSPFRMWARTAAGCCRNNGETLPLKTLLLEMCPPRRDHLKLSGDADQVPAFAGTRPGSTRLIHLGPRVRLSIDRSQPFPWFTEPPTSMCARIWKPRLPALFPELLETPGSENWWGIGPRTDGSSPEQAFR